MPPAEARGEIWVTREGDGVAAEDTGPAVGELCAESSAADPGEAALWLLTAVSTRPPRTASRTPPGSAVSEVAEGDGDDMAADGFGVEAARGPRCAARAGDRPASVGEAEVTAESSVSAKATAGTGPPSATKPRTNVAAGTRTPFNSIAIPRRRRGTKLNCDLGHWSTRTGESLSGTVSVGDSLGHGCQLPAIEQRRIFAR